jgi:4-amino-4-deoxy-L-arabinose transferase-like glycosyltransferase
MIAAERREGETATLMKVIVFAVAIRWLYCLLLYGFMGEAGITGVDSGSLLSHGENFAAQLAHGSLHGWQWVGTEPLIMPLFTWAAALYVVAFGKSAVLAYVLSQGLLDAATCYFIYRLARAIDPRAAIPAALAAAVNPTQIVVSGFFYTDTPFVFFVALFLLAAVEWLRSPSWRGALIVGLGLGGGILIRPVMAPWVPAFVVFLLIWAALRRQLSGARLGQIALMAAIFAACAGSILMRNATEYGAWSLTPQSGMHLSRWIVPLVREAKDGTPWAVTAEETERRAIERFGKWSDNPFEQSQRYRTIAVEALHKLGPTAIAKAWATGAVINLATPAIILAPPVSQLPRTGFFATRGQSTIEKIANFLFHSDNALYAWILLLGIAGVAVLRIVQLIGAVALLRAGANIWVLLLLGGWCLFILAANGPIASPKYRLPIEPVLMVLTGIGAERLMRWRRNRS